MPIYYACEFEQQAKETCLKMGGQYMGRSDDHSGHYIWQAFTGACITSFVRLTATGFDRFMVVYNEGAGGFETIALGGDSPAQDPFVTGDDPDASVELRARHAQFLYEREDARQTLKAMLVYTTLLQHDANSADPRPHVC